MSACRLVATSVSSDAGRLTIRAVHASTSSLSHDTSGNSFETCERDLVPHHHRVALRVRLRDDGELASAAATARARTRSGSRARRRRASSSTRRSRPRSDGPGARARRRRRIRPRSSRGRSPSRGRPAPQRFSGASMPGRIRVGRTLAYWSKPWQIFRRRPHSVTWSGMSRIAGRAEQDRVDVADRVEAVGRHHHAVRAVVVAAPVEVDEVERERRPSADGARPAPRAPRGRRGSLPCRCRRRESSRCGRSSWPSSSGTAAIVHRPRRCGRRAPVDGYSSITRRSDAFATAAPRASSGAGTSVGNARVSTTPSTPFAKRRASAPCTGPSSGHGQPPKPVR